jgi:hypothetical protein
MPCSPLLNSPAHKIVAMILNAYAVLDLFFAAVRVLLSLFVIYQAGHCLKKAGQGRSPEDDRALENRSYLLFLLAVVLVVLNLTSWPILYLLLQSYVPEWPGAMCIYGITQIGAGSTGVSRFLPGLLKFLQAAKPLLVFLSGAWFLLYLVNRQTQTSPLRGRLLLALLILGLVGAGDAVAEGAYVLIPKKEENAPTGCCMEVFDSAERASRFLPHALFGEDYRAALFGIYYLTNLGMALGLLCYTRGGRDGVRVSALVLFLIGALISIPVNVAFVIEVLAPAVSPLPFHYCPYDLLSDAPESLVGIGLAVLGCFSVGWAGLTWWLGQCRETESFLPLVIKNTLKLAWVGYAGSVMVLSMELALS